MTADFFSLWRIDISVAVFLMYLIVSCNPLVAIAHNRELCHDRAYCCKGHSVVNLMTEPLTWISNLTKDCVSYLHKKILMNRLQATDLFLPQIFYNMCHLGLQSVTSICLNTF